MMKYIRKGLSYDLDRLLNLREAGWQQKDIAAELGITLETVRWQCVRNGLTRQSMVPKSDNRCRRFDTAEDEYLLVLEAEGHSTSEIGRRLRRTSSTILARLAILAGREERAMNT